MVPDDMSPLQQGGVAASGRLASRNRKLRAHIFNHTQEAEQDLGVRQDHKLSNPPAGTDFP